MYCSRVKTDEMITTVVLFILQVRVTAGLNDCMKSATPTNWDYGNDIWMNMLRDVCEKRGYERKSSFISAVKEAIVPFFHTVDNNKYTSSLRSEILPVPSQDMMIEDDYVCANDGEIHPKFVCMTGKDKEENKDVIDFELSSETDDRNDDNNYIIRGLYFPYKIIYNVHTSGKTGNQRLATDVIFDSEESRYTLKLSTVNFSPNQAVGGECVVTIQDINFDPLPEPKEYSIGQFSSLKPEEGKTVSARFWTGLKDNFPSLIRSFVIQAIVMRIPQRNNWICVSQQMAAAAAPVQVGLMNLEQFKKNCGDP